MDFIDFQELKKRHPKDETFQQDIVDTFIKRMPIYSHCLQTSLDREEMEELLAYSCQLRGIAECCCIEEIQKLCLQLDSEAQDNNLKAATLIFQDIRKILRCIQTQYPTNLSYLL
ncbi:hypothetical protein Lepto7376_0605 [[Leptolyngbya] sp. PCC 7376]|uniref:hypothetical protein n=1 Tax=[Leptolyngbya] sp. PCC 7376 TaxID=111781 RepID=UPI00029EE8F2|nr:hypothetical protein [[Leptolyngbya] sp. PCC 7376]AFY37020.1 hypothetical protein Lepto7376_0605 [[Leptolyngbya] sp. PCC 7376]